VKPPAETLIHADTVSWEACARFEAFDEERKRGSYATFQLVCESYASICKYKICTRITRYLEPLNNRF